MRTVDIYFASGTSNEPKKYFYFLFVVNCADVGSPRGDRTRRLVPKRVYDIFFLCVCLTVEYLMMWTLIYESLAEMCMLSGDITDYHYVAQGKTTIPNVDDGEECQLTDVSSSPRRAPHQLTQN